MTMVVPYHQEPSSQPNPFPIEWSADVEFTPTADLVEDTLTEGGLSVVYGESGCTKTFFCTDLGHHVALGRPWFGKAASRGGVIYCALEGGRGIRNRAVAFRKHYGITDRLPFGMIISSMNLLDPGADMRRLIETVRRVAETIDDPVRLLVVDTLSRAIAGGNENAPDDMGALVRNADLIRQALSVHLLFVHHTGKDTARGARGHSLLRAATDTEIEVSRNQESGICTATVTKQRDLPTLGTFAYSLTPVEIGINARGKAVTSCVVEPVEVGHAKPRGRRAEPSLTRNQQTMFSILHAATPPGLSWNEWAKRTKEAGIGVKRKATLFATRNALKTKNLVFHVDERWAAQK